MAVQGDYFFLEKPYQADRSQQAEKSLQDVKYFRQNRNPVNHKNKKDLPPQASLFCFKINQIHFIIPANYSLVRL